MKLRATRFLVLLALTTDLGFQSVASQSSDWVERTVVTQYVKNLLDTYNSLVNLYYGYYPDSHVLDRFRLYHAVGYSFNATVMRFNSTTKAFVVFVFDPIMAASPLITIDNNDTFIHFQFPNLPESFEPSMSALLKPNNTLGIIQVQGTSVGPNGIRLAPRVWIANATTMFANIMKSSADAANYIFKNDQAGYDQDLAQISQTSSLSSLISVSQTGIGASQNPQWVPTPAELIIGIPAAIVAIVVAEQINEWLKRRENRRERTEARNAKRTEKLRRKLLGRKIPVIQEDAKTPEANTGGHTAQCEALDDANFSVHHEHGLHYGLPRGITECECGCHNSPT